MNVQTAFRPAARSEAKPLIGIYAESGAGKTWSSLLLARGFVGAGGKIGMIETEGGRGEANVGREPVGQFLVRPIRQTFSPQAYGEAITDAEREKVDALIIDSASHEWEGAGGVLAMAAANQEAGKKGVLVWQQPKISHQRHFMLRLMQTPIPLVIVCMRAKYPMEQVKGDWARSKVLEPKQADDILFEMFVHGWIDHEHGFHGTKFTLPEMALVFPEGQPISIETGRRLQQWAAVSSSPRTTPPTHQAQGDGAEVDSHTTASAPQNSNSPSGFPPPIAAANASDPASITLAHGSDAPIPTWQQYVERWRVIRGGAKSRKQVAAEWNAQRDIRKLIDWPDDATFEDLKIEVQATIDGLPL